MTGSSNDGPDTARVLIADAALVVGKLTKHPLLAKCNKGAADTLAPSNIERVEALMI